MPVRGYFSKRDGRKLSISRTGEGAPNEAGLAFHGDILTGMLTVQEAFAREAAGVFRTLTPGQPVTPEGYDPVLQSHLGIK
jgi:hypothetical protein